MPRKNSLKPYVAGGYYHIYNRGADKNVIYREEVDYGYFFHLIKMGLINLEEVKRIYKLKKKTIKDLPKNFNQQIKVICFCLMPNHFHIVIKQVESRLIEFFMRSIMTRYSKYFNQKYERIGPLFEGRYKAVLVNSNEYLLYLSRYIHLNPSTLDLEAFNLNHLCKDYRDYSFSSYQWYLNNFENEWFSPRIVLDFFVNKSIFISKKVLSYQRFVETYQMNYSDMLKSVFLDYSEDSLQ